METLRGRTFLDGADLEQIARCPHSFNYLSRISRARHCKRCEAFGNCGKFVLQRNFKGGNLPSLAGITKYFEGELAMQYGERPEAEVTARDQVMLNELLRWGKGIAEDINEVNITAETHFGGLSIRDNIDAVVCDMGVFSVVQFICDRPHQEHIMNYRALHASLWLRDTYDVETNNLMFVKMSPDGIQIHRHTVETEKNILRESIEHILSGVEVDGSSDEEKDRNLLALPVIFGEHCWRCMACFPEGASNEPIH